ncbi:MAG: hypothetical protein ACYDA2_05740 [Acidimicrobiales bacterium]
MDSHDISLAVALERHLVESGFPSDGGLDEKWVVVGLGPIPLCFPNTKARRRATLVHDLNHVISGYGHDMVGEAEIAAWELGGGCKNYWAAWFLNWAALVPGLATAPVRMLKAFGRGRRTGNLYGTEIDAMRVQPVEEVRKALRLDHEFSLRATDILLFAGVVAVAPGFAAVLGVAIFGTSPWWITSRAYKMRRATA